MDKYVRAIKEFFADRICEHLHKKYHKPLRRKANPNGNLYWCTKCKENRKYHG